MKHHKLINYTGVTNALVKRSQGYRRKNAPAKIVHVLEVLDEVLENWLNWAKEDLKKKP